MNSKKLLYLIVCVLFVGCIPQQSTTSQKKSFDQRKGMLDRIGLVEFISQNAGNQTQLSTMPLGGSAILRFDLLESDFRYVSMRILHCNADWSRSVLQDLEFLEVYNEFPIRDYSFSQTNYSEYTSYKSEIPRLNKSGNYILQVYDEDSNETLFNKRVSVFRTKIGVNVSLVRADNPAWRNSHHKIDYNIELMGLNVINPIQDLKAYIIQNNNWANLIEPIPPTEIDLGRGVISYTSFDNHNSIPSINEFRFFDTRTISNRGLRVQDQYLIEGQPQVFLEQDDSKFSQAYSEPFQEELDGFFSIGNKDFLETSLNTEYVNVNFNLKSPPVNGAVYVTGRFNNWEKNSLNQMIYDSISQSYKAKLLMKQGYYNYRYETISQELESYHFEGSHFQTRNTYEIYVYYREPGTVYDQLIGYKVFNN